jgi:transposase InsO family protein
VYPYLLRGVPITRVNHVWSTDITSIRLHGGFIYLVAVMDWFSRYVLSWAVSITMDVGCCLEALEQALELARPEILGIRLRRDSWVSVMYAEALHATTSSVTLQRTDRQGILGQKPWHLPVSL